MPRNARLTLRSALLGTFVAAAGCDASPVYGPPDYCALNSVYSVTFVEDTQRPTGATALLAAKYSIEVQWSWLEGGGGFTGRMDPVTVHRISQEPVVASVDLSCNSPDPAIRR